MTVFVVMGDTGGPFASEAFMSSVHRTREGAEKALTALGEDGRYGGVIPVEVQE